MELICLICMYEVLHVLLMRQLRHAEIRVQGYTEVLNRRHKWDIGVSDVNDRRQKTVDRHSSMIMASVLLSFS